MENESVKWESILNKHNLEVSELPQNVQKKIETFESLFEEYEELNDDDENAIADTEAKLLALDNGISSDIQSYIDEKKEMSNGGNVEQENKPEKTQENSNPIQTSEDKPSWNFWI